SRPEIDALLKSARAALANEEYARALALAKQALALKPDAHSAFNAFQIVAWAHYLDGRLDESAEALALAKRIARPDPALEGAILFGRGDLAGARRLLEAARSAGDGRKDLAGTLIQVLIAQSEIARAAAIALDISDTLSDDDARKMAQIAFEGAAFEWSARL